MCIRDSTYLAPKTTPFDPVSGQGSPNFAYGYVAQAVEVEVDIETGQVRICLLYTSDAADDLLCVDLGGRRIIKKKRKKKKKKKSTTNYRQTN